MPNAITAEEKPSRFMKGLNKKGRWLQKVLMTCWPSVKIFTQSVTGNSETLFAHHIPARRPFRCAAPPGAEKTPKGK